MLSLAQVVQELSLEVYAFHHQRRSDRLEDVLDALGIIDLVKVTMLEFFSGFAAKVHEEEHGGLIRGQIASNLAAPQKSKLPLPALKAWRSPF